MVTAVPIDREILADNIAASVYAAVRAKAVSHAFLPGERLNEGELARELNVSRTPLREALYRLTTEGFLRNVAGKGFFFRNLDPKELFSLYELRTALEVAATQLAIERASDEQIHALAEVVREEGAGEACTQKELIAQDERFHTHLVALAGNLEMSRVLDNINARIQFVRWMDIGATTRKAAHHDHNKIVAVLARRDFDTCCALLKKHIERRQDEIVAAAHARVGQLYTERAARAQA
ncbi:GntR family transcriptional regulator [Achromobacter aloeverae]|uniref:GntR family transcriptional regulator n=1 Tax=Achromobacter aloeverae TaxID=1750518 RepID=A0A4Q1HIK2_9BURK|nr:GntR family transcriptional regulator [Achromobacter aloeverae]RXN88054.1 GntR family transcriptional regulator [Achromobacter aloeverae]